MNRGATIKLQGLAAIVAAVPGLFVAEFSPSRAMAAAGLLCGVGLLVRGFGLNRLTAGLAAMAALVALVATLAGLGALDGLFTNWLVEFLGSPATGASGGLYILVGAALAGAAAAMAWMAIGNARPGLAYPALALGHVTVALGGLGLLCGVMRLSGLSSLESPGLTTGLSLLLLALGWALYLQGRDAAGAEARPAVSAVPVLVGGLAAALALFLVFSRQEDASNLDYAQTRALEGVEAFHRRIDITESALLRIALLMSEQREVLQGEWTAVVDSNRSDLPGLVQCDIESNGRLSRSPAEGRFLRASDAGWARAFGPGQARHRVQAGFVQVDGEPFLYLATFANGSIGHRVRILAVFQPAPFMAAALTRPIVENYSCRLLVGGDVVYQGDDLGGDAPWSSFAVGDGQAWSLQLRPSPGLLKSRRSSTPFAVLIAGGLCAALVSYSGYRSAQARKRALQVRQASRDSDDSRASLEQLIASLPEAVLVVGADGRVEQVGGAQLAVLSRPGSTLVGRSVDDFIGLDEGGIKLRDTKKVLGMDGLVGQRVDAVVRGENGQTNYCVIRISALETSEGRKYLWSVADIQWRKVAEEERNRLIEELRKQIEANRELATRHSALVNCGAIGMGLVDPEGRFLEFNQTFESTVGYSRAELLNMSLKDLNHPDDQPQASNFLAEMKQGIREGYHTQKRYLRKDGTAVWVDVTGAALRGQGGELQGIIGIMLDVSERVAATKALEASEQKYQLLNEQLEARNRELQAILEESRESTERFRTLLASAPEATILVDPEGRILEFNRRAQELLGYTEAEALALSVEALVPPEVRPRHEGIRRDYMAAPEHRMMARGRDLVAMAKDGSRVPVEINLSPLRFRGQVMVAASMVDLRERLRVADELRMSERRLRAANKELESIVYVASHDMRSPLVNLQGFSRQLANAAEKLYPMTAKLPSEEMARAETLLKQDIPEAVGFIAASTRKMDGLIKGLLRLSRLGRAPLQLRDVDMNLLLTETISATQFVLTERNVQVELGDLPSCWGDETQLGQVFSNLVDNAIKYRDRKRPGIIRVRGRVVDEYAVYEVEDNGIGIAPDHQVQIFEVFHRLAPDGDVPGEGLGLSVVRRILDRHDGDVRVESTPGVGSRFTVILPRRPGARGASEVENGQPN